MRVFFTFLAFVVLSSNPALALDFNPLKSNLLPSWPIDKVGDPIPDDLIASWKGDFCPSAGGKYSAFPAKGNLCLKGSPNCKPPRDRDPSDTDPLDPGRLCDDGDQTTYNGLLCASGDADGCNAVAHAQNHGGGRWFRSPHRLWMSQARCADLAKLADKKIFNDNCAYGFSPDMNLGVLLYTLKTKDVDRYERWLSWVDNESQHTKLCTLDSNREPTSDCIFVEWPRVCVDDLGHLNPDEDPGMAIGGRYGGKCALRPWDTLDFSAVNTAVGVSYPRRLAAWDVESRSALAASKVLLAAIPGGLQVAGASPLIIMSSVDAKHFPTHLDAIRVLIRMMILNPSLELDNLPTLPDPESLIPDITKEGISDGADLMTIKASATIIAERVPWDPFYQLLAHGPTPGVRSSIVEHCPATGDVTVKSDWIWEKADDKDGSKLKSMGWDCVFLGKLYNKMRVRKNVFDELFAWFIKYGDGVEKLFVASQKALQLAQAEINLRQHTFDAAKAQLDNASEFVNKTFKASMDALESRREQVERQVNDATKEAADLGKKLNQLAGELAGCVPATVPVPTPPECDLKVAGHCVHWGLPGVKQVPNPVCAPIKSAIGQANAGIDAAQKAAAAGQAAFNEIEATKTQLNKQLADTTQELQKGTLQAAYNAAKAGLDEESKILSKVQHEEAHYHAAYSKARNYVCVWKTDAKCQG